MYQKPLRSDELYHWGLPWGRKKTKYIYKVQDGNYTRYFYSQDELDAYRNADRKVNAQKKSVASNPLQGIKDFVDYKITGRGYTRDAKRKNKDIDELSKLQKKHPLRVDEEKASVFKEMAEKTKRPDSKLMDPSADLMNKKHEKDYQDYVAVRRNRTLENTAKYAKQFNLDEAEKKAMNNSLFGKVSKFFKKRSDNKVVNFMKENPDYAEKWLNDLGITTKDFNPKKARNADKLKKTLVNRGVMKETDTLNDVLEDRGFVEKERGRMEYYKDSNKKKKKAVKHSDDELQSFLDTNSDELMHYGRLGMKWYQHIFGPVQAGAKYAQKAGSKIVSAKSAHDAKAEAKWEKKKEKVIRSGDPAKVRKYQSKMTDDELRRAENRITERGKLDKMTGHDRSIQQAQNFVNQNSNKNSVDVIKSFSNIANSIDTSYKSFDKIMKTIDEAKKYTPEGMARAAEVKRAMSNLDMPWILENVDKMTSKQREDVLKDYKNLNDIKIRYNDQQKQASSPTVFKDFMTEYSSKELTSFKDYQRFKDGYIPYTISDKKDKKDKNN